MPKMGGIRVGLWEFAGRFRGIGKTASARGGTRSAYPDRPATTPTASTGILPRIQKSVGAASQPAEGVP